MRRLLFILLSINILFSCYEPKEGCLDIEAVNYDATADVSTECRYPRWQVNIVPVYDDAVYQSGTPRKTPEDQWFRVERFAFYLSDFRALQNGVYQGVTDTLQVRAYSGATDSMPAVLTRDVLLFRFPTLEYPLGEFRPLGAFDSVQFRFGLSELARRTIPGSAPSGHALRIQSDSLWRSRAQGYYFAKLVVGRDSAGLVPSDTLHFSAADVGELLITKGGSFRHEFATDFVTSLRVDYGELFRGVDFSVYDTVAWKVKIVENLQNAITVGQ